jgi:tRNA U34 2-thiouridine synthase MnmA/TrmU
LGVALGKAYEVTEINARDNTITIEPVRDKSGFKKSFEITSLNFGYISGCDLQDMRQTKFYAKIRYAAKLVLCAVEIIGDDTVVYLDEAVKAVAPGQSCVIYMQDSDGEWCIAFGGIIK